MKWQDNCTNPWHGVDDAGGCARGCLDVFVIQPAGSDVSDRRGPC